MFPAMHSVHDEVLCFIDDESRDSFDRLALEVFRHQFESIEPYRRFCERRGVTPTTVSHWSAVPPTPIEAFKQVDLCCSRPHRTFLSTGTTAGPERRSRHLIPDLRLYRRSAHAGLRTFLFPDLERIGILSLIQPPEAAPDSSLAQMVAWAIADFGDERSACAVDEGQLRFEHAADFLREAENSGRPCCLMTTTAALIRFLDRANAKGLAFRLPHGSRLMDTGGDKGAPRPMSRNGLIRAVWNTLAIPGYFCVNEYGMCELSSQFYDNVIADRRAGRFTRRCKAGPHWVRTVVLDPVSLRPAGAGERGRLCHYDLANAGTAMAVLTEDIGATAEGGFDLWGRAAQAELRGCSLALAQWPDAAASQP